MKPLVIRPALLLAALTGALLAQPASAAPAHKPVVKSAAWLNTVTVSPSGGHVVGNPQAEKKLVEYMSYTCPHCAHFESEGALALRMGYVANGQVSFEVRHFLRDPIDVAIATLTNCVTPMRFFALHRRFLVEQPKWIAVAQTMTGEQVKRWNEGPMPERLRAIASDLKLYDIVASASLSRPAADACFANEALLRKIVGQTRDAQTMGVDSTPSFLLNGELLKDEHDWPSLQKRLSGAPAR